MAKKNSLWVYLTVMLAAMVGLAMTPLANAQDTSSPTQTQDQSQKAVTATGCLQKAASGSGYQLTDSSSMKTYDLTASSSDVDLSAHVGHTVTVTGTPSSASTSSASTTPTNPDQSTNPASNPAASSQSQNPQLSVTNVKMVSSSCQSGR